MNEGRSARATTYLFRCMENHFICSPSCGNQKCTAFTSGKWKMYGRQCLPSIKNVWREQKKPLENAWRQTMACRRKIAEKKKHSKSTNNIVLNGKRKLSFNFKHWHHEPQQTAYTTVGQTSMSTAQRRRQQWQWKINVFFLFCMTWISFGADHCVLGMHNC